MSRSLWPLVVNSKKGINRITIQGKNFVLGAQVLFWAVAAVKGSPVCPVVRVTPDTIICNLNVNGCTGLWRVQVKLDTQFSSATNYLIKSASIAPMITRVDGCEDQPDAPAGQAQDACRSLTIITFTGRNFGWLLTTLEVSMKPTSQSTSATPTCSLLTVSPTTLTCRLHYLATTKGRFKVSLNRGGVMSPTSVIISTQRTPVIKSVNGCKQDVYLGKTHTRLLYWDGAHHLR